MRWLNSQTLSSLLLMPPVLQAICWTVWGPRCSLGWRKACHRLPARPVTSPHLLCLPRSLHIFQRLVRSEGVGSLSALTAPILASLSPSHAAGFCGNNLSSCQHKPSSTESGRELDHHLGLRTHSQWNWTPRVNYAALTKEKETVYSPLQVGEKYPSLSQ